MDEPRDTLPTEQLDELDHLPLEELVTRLIVSDGQLVDDDVGLAVTLESLRSEFPAELRISVADDGGVSFAIAPPTQHVATTILPVWHQLRVTVARTEEDTIVDAEA